MLIILLFVVFWWLEKQARENAALAESAPKSKLKVYDMPDDLYVNGVYQVGDEFKL